MKFIFTLLYFIPIYFLLDEIVNMYKSHKAQAWAKCDGKLQKWQMHSVVDTEDTTFFIDELEYSYAVKDKEFKSNILGYGFPQGLSQYLTDKLTDFVFSNAPNVTVFYNQKNPNQAVLVTGLHLYHIFKLIIISFILFGGYVLISRL